MAKNNNVKKANTGSGNGKILHFSFAAPDAMTVQLVGDFTHWQQKPINMQKGPTGIWNTKVELPRGEHYYRFLVDGQWRDDPECTVRLPNAFGSQNCVCQAG